MYLRPSALNRSPLIVSSSSVFAAIGLFLACFAIGAHPVWAQTPANPVAPVVVGDVVNTIGWDLVKPGQVGELDIGPGEVVFADKTARSAIPSSAIRTAVLEHTTRPLLRGVKGTVAMFAPQGAGQLYSAIRPGAEALTLLYADQDQGLHAAVVLVPTKEKAAAHEALEAGGVRFSDDLVHEAGVAAAPVAVASLPASTGQRPSIRVLFPRSEATGAPVMFLAGVYEDLIDQLAKSGAYEHVWRDGDARAEPNTFTLAVNVMHVKKGSAGARGALPVLGFFLGETLIDAAVHVTDASGAAVLNRQLQGTKRLPGESMAATRSLASHVSRALKEAANAWAATAGAQGRAT